MFVLPSASPPEDKNLDPQLPSPETSESGAATVCVVSTLMYFSFLPVGCGVDDLVALAP